MILFDKNEIKWVWIQVEERDAGVVTVASATFEVFAASGASVQASADAAITNNGTIAVTLSGLVDTSTANFISGATYEVKFTYQIDSETYIDAVSLRLA